MSEQRGGTILRVTAGLFLAIGLFLAVGGAWLLVLGGSPYYAAAGVLMMVSGGLFWIGNPWAATVYELTAVATLVWAIWEAGMDGWALAPRVGLPLLLALWLFTPWMRHALHAGQDSDDDHDPSWKRTAAAIAVAVLGAGAAFAVPNLWAGEASTAEAAPQPTEADGNWPHYGNDLGGSRYSPLTQINEHNVAGLAPAWQFRTGVSPGTESGQRLGFEVTPIEIDDTLYLCTPNNIVIALNAETGAERWRFDPKTRTAGAGAVACRGVSYHARPGQTGACAKRIIAATLDARLFAVDAGTGKPCADFGGRGVLSLIEGLAPVLPGSYAMTAPPLVAGNRVIVGGWLRYRNAPGEAFGLVRAFDVATGRRLWTWDMGRTDQGAGRAAVQAPEPWAPFVADPELNLVYVPTGNDIPDFESARRPSYGNSIVALDLASGQPKWSFQTVHHDRWDSDVAAQPVLVDLPTIDGMTPALVQATRHGQIFVLNRRDGKPMTQIAERRVPGAATGKLSATQPFSALSLLPARLTEYDMWGLTPLDQLVCRIRFRGARYEGPFTPPGGGPSLQYPGRDGLVGWGGVAVDQVNKLVVANTSATASYVAADGSARPFLGPLGVPCSRPPWGHLHLVDLKTDKHAWSQKIGTARDSGPFGLPSLPVSMGTRNEGGSLVTRGALIFNGGTEDHYLRAYNLFSGAELWKARLPAGGQATPMTYATRSGRQFVVIGAGDSIMAYALPPSGA